MIYSSCANQKGKGTLFALKRLELFMRKASKNFTSPTFCLKADIKHYFQEINHKILFEIISRKIKEFNICNLIKKIMRTQSEKRESNNILKKGMPLGNLTSQFFANVYLHELDYFVKNKLKAKYYIRYVDDFIILHNSKKQLKNWKIEIDKFLKDKLKIELHPEKSRIIPLKRGIDFVGFRNFGKYKLLRKRNVRIMEKKIEDFGKGKISFKKVLEIHQGWQAYAKWGNSCNLRNKIKREIVDEIWNRV